MKNEKQIKIGSMVRLASGSRALRWPPYNRDLGLLVGVYGIVCDIKDSERHSQSHRAYCIHLQNGEKFWAWKSEFEVLA